MTKTLLLTNWKGGVGKTSLNSIICYLLQQRGYKVLGIDFDSQTHLTMSLKSTFGDIAKPMRKFSDGLKKGILKQSIVKVNENLDLIPGDRDLKMWSLDINLNHKSLFSILKNALKNIDSKYDYIVIDTPPSFDVTVYNSMMVADGVALIMPTETFALSSAQEAVQDITRFRSEYNPNMNFIGTIVYMYKNASTDRKILNEAKDYFNNALFNNIITQQERVNYWMDNGISESGYWDSRAIKVYNDLLDEIIERME